MHLDKGTRISVLVYNRLEAVAKSSLKVFKVKTELRLYILPNYIKYRSENTTKANKNKDAG